MKAKPTVQVRRSSAAAVAVATITLVSLASAVPEIRVAAPADGANHPSATAVVLTAEVERKDYERIRGVDFYADGELVAQGQIAVWGQWMFDDGVSLGMGGPDFVDLMTSSEGMFLMSGVFPTPNLFNGTFELNPWNTPAPSGPVSMVFTYGADSTLNVAITAAVPLGNRNLTGGYNDAWVQTFSASWANPADGPHVITAKVRYNDNSLLTSAPVSITVGATAPVPLFRIVRASATHMELRWQNVGAGWYPQAQAGLSPTGWADVAGTATLSDGWYSLIVPMNGPKRFYRLAKP